MTSDEYEKKQNDALKNSHAYNVAVTTILDSVLTFLKGVSLHMPHESIEARKQSEEMLSRLSDRIQQRVPLDQWPKEELAMLHELLKLHKESMEQFHQILILILLVKTTETK